MGQGIGCRSKKGLVGGIKIHEPHRIHAAGVAAGCNTANPVRRLPAVKPSGSRTVITGGVEGNLGVRDASRKEKK
ncbi:hypothetical protein [Nitrosomonas sp.]|uniref:hypothetical protein n=1 Tax=Nitrosomonas sp. TaxID=42353 RepID=UPI00272F3E5E|nr:hypothetical protein [Nitrosomonas sp.]MDP1788581.1 hypothetical protein [Nitrosomonas sp.]